MCVHETLTGGEHSRLSVAQRVILLCVKRGRVLCVRLQVEEGVLSEAGGQAQLLGGRALDGEEEPVAGDFGPGGKPHHHSAVFSHVGEVDICRSVGL